MVVSKSALRLSAVTAVLLGLIAGPQAIAQTSPYLEKAARVQEMRAQMPTQAQREAAAAELKAFKAKIEQARKQALKAGLSRPASAQLPPGVLGPQPGGFPDYFTTSNWAFSPPLRKFINTLPGLGPTGANDLGNYIPVANADTTTYPGSDYYEISVRQYPHQFHGDLPATTLRGYVQTNNGTDGLGQNTLAPAPISYLGPIIVAKRDRPVRIKFTNELPVGQGGDLMVPVDTTIQGSGPGPLFPASMIGQPDGLGGIITATTPCDASPIASNPPGNATPGQPCANYTQNRAAIHLHGGRTPWISDGTPHQWVIPAGEWANTPYKEGVSLENVPDMPNPGPGAVTYYFSNQQSARLMFYHDHAWGITRLNVLVGMAAGYLITDDFEAALVGTAQNPGPVPAEQIPLVIQDRTFVADDVRSHDPTWNWGTGAVDGNGVRAIHVGDLWIPHVYEPAQNPYDPTGVNPYGRWVYGPWFFPPTTNIMWNTVANPYHDPACSDPDPAVYAFCTTPGQPPVVPGTPIPSVGAETFFDTAVVNGAAFPSLTVEPKAYRFRILNAANDRFMNLNIFKADPAQVAHDGRTLTEVKMIPATGGWDTAVYPNWPADGRPEQVPDPTTAGPAFIQIGTEGGFLPRPVVRDIQPITYVTDPTAFNVGNVKDFGLFLGPAERADVIVDFSRFAGQTLILYNDAPAAVPAFDPRHDFLAGAPDLSATGGYGRPPPWDPAGPVSGPQIGYGPNTRTIMQIKVAATTPAAPYDVAALEAAFAPDPATAKRGVFEQAQDPIIVGQDAYNGVYTGATFPQVWPYWGFSRIEDEMLSVATVGGTHVTFPMEPKGMHDEMGASFDMEYGRMSANLGMTNPQRVVGMLNLTIYKFHDPSTEILNDALGTTLTPALGDGTQIWKISHNGVDTHPIHFHIFDVQVINRVGWDGQIRPPHPSELGWKDTVRISPLEDTIVAMRPWAPKLPFGVPNSLRPLNPALPLNATYGFTNIDPVTQQAKVPADVNRVDNFGWEYVWHCHILSHEENDMMRPIVLNVVSGAPGTPSPLSVNTSGANPVLSWTDATPVNYVTQTNFGNQANEIAFRIERTADVGGGVTTMFALANQTSFTDTTAVAGAYYRYRVVAYNEAGEAASNVVEVGAPASATAATSVDLTANPASGFVQVLPGTPVVFTAQGVGGSGAYEYRFSVNGTVAQAYGPANTFTLPVTTPAGTYDVKVDVRTTVTVDSDASNTLSYTVAVPTPATLTLAALPATASVFYGTAVTYTATGAGSAGYEYRFSLNGGTGFALVQDWSAVATWTLPATTPIGSYTVRAEVRTTASAVDAVQTLTTAVVYRPATTLTLRSSIASPFPVTNPPTTVTFLAMGGGSTGTPSLGYLYRFSLSSDNLTFTEVQPYGTSKLWTLPTSTAPGTYYLRAEVTTTPGAATPDKVANMTFVVQNAASATGVTLTASLPSPQGLNTAVTFTAAGQGSTGYQYRFLLSTNGGPFVEQQAFSTTATWTLPATTPEGSYQVQAQVKASPTAIGAEATSTPFPFLIRAVAAATSVTLAADRTSPAAFNIVPVATVFTATPVATGPVQYRFSLSTNGGAFVVVQDYPGTSTWTMPASTPIGNYTVKVDVRTSTFVDLDATTSMPFQLVTPLAATGVTIAPDLGSPQVPGTAVTFTGQGQGSSGYQYRFWWSINKGASWSVVRDWSLTNTWTMPGTTPIGSYLVSVEVRTTTTVSRDAVSPGFTYVIANAPATGVTISANLPSPQPTGVAVTFTAQGQGSTGYTYRFFRSSNGGATWAVVQDWAATNTWVMPTSTGSGNYLVSVEVRTNASVARDAVSVALPFTITNPPATGVTISASPSSPRTPGTAVTFTAQGTGSTGYSYRFWWSTNKGASWSIVRDWSATNTWVMPGTTPIGTYLVSAEVRTTTQVARDAVSLSLTFVIDNAPATGVTLGPDLTSPQAMGTAVVFTAQGQGSTGYTYRFFRSINGGLTWAVVQDWSATNTWSLPATTTRGSYLVSAEVRTSINVARDAVSPAVPFVIQ